MPMKLPMAFGLLVAVSASGQLLLSAADLCDAGGVGNDTCASAKDGFCDEVSLCGEGTDCTDCGPGRRRISARVLQPLKHDMLQEESRRLGSCNWEQTDTDKFYKKMQIGSLCAGLIGFILIVVISMPVCCGKFKKFGKPIGLVVLFSGLFIMFVPMIAASSSCSGLTNDICSDCDGTSIWGSSSGSAGCSEIDRKSISDTCNALGFFIVYFGCLGFIAFIFGIVSASISCCAFCNACAMKEDQVNPNGVNTVVVGQQVVGQPVSNTGIVPGK